MSSRAIRLGPSGTALDPEIVLHVADSGRHLGEVLRPAPKTAGGDVSRQRDLTILDLHLDLGGVDEGIVGKTLADVLPEPLVRALISFRPPPAVGTGAPPARIGPARAAPRIPVGRAKSPVAGVVAVARREAFIIRRSAMSIIDKPARKFVRVASLAAVVIPAAQSADADGAARRNIAVTVVIVERVCVPSAIVTHVCSPPADSSNSPASAGFHPATRTGTA